MVAGDALKGLEMGAVVGPVTMGLDKLLDWLSRQSRDRLVLSEEERRVSSELSDVNDLLKHTENPLRETIKTTFLGTLSFGILGRLIFGGWLSAGIGVLYGLGAGAYTTLQARRLEETLRKDGFSYVPVHSSKAIH